MDYTDATFGQTRLDAMLAMLREPATNAAQATPKSAIAAQLVTRAVETPKQTEEYIHRSAQPTDAQQYLALAIQAVSTPNIPGQAFDVVLNNEQQQHHHDLNDDLALTQLLANNGSIFNGGVGGLNNRSSDATAKAAVAGVGSRKEIRDRKLARIRGILNGTPALQSDEHTADEQDADEESSLAEFDEYMDSYGAESDDDEAADDQDDEEALAYFEQAMSVPESTPAPAYGHYGIESDSANRRLVT